jgi:hypothetical protein
MTRADIIKWNLVTLSSLRSWLNVTLAEVLLEQKDKLKELELKIETDPLKNGKISRKVNATFGAINALERKTVILQNIELIQQQLDRENPDNQRLREAANYMASLNSCLEEAQNIPTWIMKSLVSGESLLREQTLVL